MITGWFFFIPLWALLSQLPRRGVFLFVFTPQPGRCCRSCLAGACFFLFFRLCILAQQSHIWYTKVISGTDFLKNPDIWSDFIKLDLAAMPWAYLGHPWGTSRGINTTLMKLMIFQLLAT